LITENRKNSSGITEQIPLKLKRKKTLMQDEIKNSFGESGNLKIS